MPLSVNLQNLKTAYILLFAEAAQLLEYSCLMPKTSCLLSKTTGFQTGNNR